MEINVMLNELEHMNTEIHNYSEVINQVSSNFKTACQELMSEVESELDEEINTAIEETTRLSEKIFLALKRHESFVLDAYNTYGDVDKDVFLSIQKIKGLELNYSNAVPSQPREPLYVLPYVPHYVLDYFPIIWPDTKPVTPYKRKGDIIVVPGFIDKIAKYDALSVSKALLGAFVVITPGAIVSLINDIIPIILGEFTGVKTGEENDSGDMGLYNAGDKNFEELVDEVGNAERVNFNFVKAWLMTEIVNYILQEYTVISELSNYQTLGKTTEITDDDIEEQSGIDKETEKDEAKLAFVEAKTKKDNLNINIPLSNATAFGGEYAAYKTGDYFSRVGSVDENDEADSWRFNKNSTDDAEANEIENSTASKKQFGQNERADSYGSVLNGGNIETDSPEKSTVGAGGYSSEIDDEELFSSMVENPDVIEGNINVSEGYFSSNDELAERYSAKTKSNLFAAFNNTSDKSSIIYKNIVASAESNSEASVRISTGVIGASAVGVTGTGTLGSLFFNSFGASDVENAIKCVNGALKFTNLFDMVGKAERCSINWLSETVNVLAQ